MTAATAEKTIELEVKMKKYNLYEVSEMVTKYHKNILTLIELENQRNREIAPAIARYGIEASMPSGKGTTGNPVLREVERLNKKTPLEEELEKKIKFIQDFRDSLAYKYLSNEEAYVFESIMNGASQQSIAEPIGVSKAYVQDKIQRVAEIITERQGEIYES